MISIAKINAPSGRERLNLFCFHWAGGTNTAYKPLGIHLESYNIAVYTITLPGRNGRDTSSMFRRFPELVSTVLSEFCKFHAENSIGDLPIILFGHSFGGLLAYELKRVLSADDNPRIVIDRVIVSAVRTPIDITEQNENTSRECHFLQSDADLMKYITQIGGSLLFVVVCLIRFFPFTTVHIATHCLQFHRHSTRSRSGNRGVYAAEYSW